MAGTSEGSRKAAETSRKRYGQDFHKKMGAKSWDNERSHKVGFALDKQRAVEAGRKGGSRKKNKNENEEEWTTFEEIHAIAEIDNTELD